MKIVHISTCDDIIGAGAAIAAYRLHRGLLRLGHDSSMFVAHRRQDDPTVTAFVPPMDLRSRLRRRLRHEQITHSFARYRNSRPDGYEIFTDDRTGHGADVLVQLPASDVINVHSIQRFVDYRAFFSAVPRRTPVVQTLHDMSPFTGGCHYDAGCGKYTERCGACPQLGSVKTKDLSRQIWQRKHSVFNSSIALGRLHLVAPSRWMAEEVKQSTLLGNFPVTVIANGLDIDDFAPRDRCVARHVLGIPQDARVVLFVAGAYTRRIKGFALLVHALDGLCDLTNLLLVSLGGGNPPVSTQIPHLHLGLIRNDRLLSLIYSAADVFVIPSLQENLPTTVMEAMACGTPVVGFAVGGIPDMVCPGITGLLAPPHDVAALRDAIREILRDPQQRSQMAANCRRVAVEEYALEVAGRRYAELYESVLASPSSNLCRL